jgi:hypothetical protein
MGSIARLRLVELGESLGGFGVFVTVVAVAAVAWEPDGGFGSVARRPRGCYEYGVGVYENGQQC